LERGESLEGFMKRLKKIDFLEGFKEKKG